MRKKLGEILIASGAVTQADLDLALNDQTAGEPARLGDLLVALGRISPVQLARALSQQHAIPFIQLPAVPPEVLLAVPLDFQQQHRVVPFRVSADAISLAMADPSNADAVETLRQTLHKKITRYVAAGDEIDALHADLVTGTIDLPTVAPVVKPVKGSASPPTAKDLFGNLNDGHLGDELFSGLDLPPAVAVVPPPPTVAPLKGPKPRRREEEEEPEFFEAAPPPRTQARSVAPIEEISLEEAAESPTQLEPLPEEEVQTFEVSESAVFGSPAETLAAPDEEISFSESSGDFAAEPSGDFGITESSGDFAVAEPSGDFGITESSGEFGVPAASVAESSGSFDVSVSELETPPVDPRPSPALDDFFSAGRPLASSLSPPPVEPGAFSAEEEVAVSFEELPEVPDEPVDTSLFENPESATEALFSEVAEAASELPEPLPPVEQVNPLPASRESLPSWLGPADVGSTSPAPMPVPVSRAARPAPAAWTGALDDLPPSKLVTAAVKALITKGLVTEAEILEALGKKS